MDAYSKYEAFSSPFVSEGNGGLDVDYSEFDIY